MKKLAELEAIVSGYGSALLAFSGGVDSTFLLAVGRRVLKESLRAVTVHTFLNEREEYEGARERAKVFRVPHEVIEIDLAGREEIVSNPPDRCYHCKKFLFGLIAERARAHGMAVVMDATHADDLPEDRPGMRALEEIGVRSPLREAGITKAELRELSARMGLEGADRPASPCLATRVPFGVRLTQERLRRILGAEKILKGLGFTAPRVRDYGDLARVEVIEEEIDRAASWPTRKGIYGPLRDMGYTFVTIDLMGYRSGSMSETEKRSKS